MSTIFEQLGYNIGDDPEHPDFRQALKPYAELVAEQIMPCHSEYIQMYSQAWQAILQSWEALVKKFHVRPSLRSVIHEAESKLVELSTDFESENPYLKLIQQTLEDSLGQRAEAIII